MAPQTYPLFNSLPESIRDDIWSRATTDIATAPSVRLVDIRGCFLDPRHEVALLREAEASVLREAGLGGVEDLEHMAREEREKIWERQREAIRSALRAYCATMVRIMPSADDRALAPYKAAWTLGDLAGVSKGALGAVTGRLREL
jgi:hypothetical protein